MRVGRIVKWAVPSLLAGALIVCAVAYILASRIPPEYSPARLKRPEKDAAMREFRRRVMDFSNEGQRNQPFVWTISAESINRYLDSMDEIAVHGGAKPGTVDRALRKAGLTEPAVAVGDGRVRLMARLTKFHKIASIDLKFEFPPAGKMRVVVAGAWIGQAPVPASVVRQKLEALKRTLARRLEAASLPAGAQVDGVSSANIAEAIERVLSAIDGEPIDTDFAWKVQTKKRVRISKIDASDGEMRISIVPVKESRGQMPR